MRREIRNIAKESLSQKGPVLSVFLNLKDEDHSFKKIRSILVSAQKELIKNGQKIPWIDRVLSDEMVSGRELGFNEGLSDTNIAFFAVGDSIHSIRIENEVDETFHISSRPIIIPAISNSLSSVKCIVLDRKHIGVYSFHNNLLRPLAKNFKLLDEEELENFDNQVVQDRTKKRTDEMIKSHIKSTLQKIQGSCLKKDDQIVVFAPAEYISYVKKNFEQSPFKKNYLVVKHNFPSFDLASIEKKTKEIASKNKLGEFKKPHNSQERTYNSLNTIKKEISHSNIRSLSVSQAFIENVDISNQLGRELNDFLCDLAANGVELQVLKGMDKNFALHLYTFDEGKIYGQP